MGWGVGVGGQDPALFLTEHLTRVRHHRQATAVTQPVCHQGSGLWQMTAGHPERAVPIFAASVDGGLVSPRGSANPGPG